MANILRRIIAFIADIGSRPDDSTDTRVARYMLNIGFAAASLMVMGVVGPIYLIFNEPLAGWNYMLYGVFTVANMLAFARHRNYHVFATAMGIYTPLSVLGSIVILGGFVNSGGAALWTLLYPTIGMLILYGTRRAMWWSIPFLLLLALTMFGGPLLRQSINVPEVVTRVILFVNLLTVFAITIGVMGYFVAQRDMAYRLLSGEQQKAENLLLSILPKEIADILKDEQRVIADSFDGASVLFADIVNFTPLSATMTPIELVTLLNDVFTHFDSLVDRHGLEKIKTIGDCYMVAAGVPRPRADHAHILTQMALEIQDYVADTSFNGKKIAFRVGINSGPVVAGVIGRKKFIYDLWGDAVNTASRMESHGSQGVIQISRSTYDLIKDDFACEPRGLITIKGKGEMEVWHVTRQAV